eukprot:1946554-Rhodomonas_salina.3
MKLGEKGGELTIYHRRQRTLKHRRHRYRPRFESKVTTSSESWAYAQCYAETCDTRVGLAVVVLVHNENDVSMELAKYRVYTKMAFFNSDSPTHTHAHTHAHTPLDRPPTHPPNPTRLDPAETHRAC